jgi:hypothetical protein
MELGQNAGTYFAATGGQLLGLLWGFGGGRRARTSRLGPALALGAVLTLGGTALRAAWAERALPGRITAVTTWRRLRPPALLRARLGPAPTAQRGQPATPLPGAGSPPPTATPRSPDPPRTPPNFAWSDIRGCRRSLTEALRGAGQQHALLVFFQPQDAKLVPLLARLASLRRDFPSERLGLLAICLSEDLVAAGQAAELAGPEALLQLPVVTDWGRPITTAFFDDRHPSSIVSFHLNVRSTPTAVLMGSDGKERTRDLPLDDAGWQDLKARLRTALESTP